MAHEIAKAGVGGRTPGLTGGERAAFFRKGKTVKTTQLRPLRDIVLIRPDASLDKTAGGLHIPDSVRMSRESGVVLAVGPGRITDRGVLIEPRVRVGERVMFLRQPGNAFAFDDGEALLFRESDLYCVVEDAH